jgi:phage FluMu protein gp41
MTAVTAHASRELTAQDRCDACSAAARVVATLLSGELMFCGHHARKHSDKLRATAIIYDPDNELTN